MSRPNSRRFGAREDRRPRLADFARAGLRPRGLRTAWLATALAGVALATSGCDDVRRTLGIDKSPPDEFTVVSRAPLSLPPDFALRPPQPGAPRPQEQTQYNRARDAVIGRPGQAPADGQAAAPVATPAGRQARSARNAAPQPAAQQPAVASPGEAAILARSGAAQADPTIRDTVNRESGQPVEGDETLLERLLYGHSNTGPLVDPDRESQRLREAQATGRAPNEGDTPTIQRRRHGLLDGLF
jgi:hypothetical protein